MLVMLVKCWLKGQNGSFRQSLKELIINFSKLTIVSKIRLLHQPLTPQVLRLLLALQYFIHSSLFTGQHFTVPLPPWNVSRCCWVDKQKQYL